MSVVALLPPSANWYSSSACDWSQKGISAYTAKNCIRLFHPIGRIVEGCLLGHADRVTSLEFCKIPGDCPGTKSDTLLFMGLVHFNLILVKYRRLDEQVWNLFWPAEVQTWMLGYGTATQGHARIGCKGIFQRKYQECRCPLTR